MRRLLAVALLAAPLAAQEPLVTDRPDFTESAVTVAAGMIQVELGATGTLVAHRADMDLEALARIGIGSRLEVRGGASDPDRGYAGAKARLLASRQFDLAVLAGMTFPAAASADDRLSPELHLAVSRPLGTASLAAMTSVLFQSAVGDGVRMAQTLVLGGGIAGPVGGFVELASEWGGGLAAVHLAHVGATLLLSPGVQLDLHGGIPIGAAGESFVGGGLAVRFRLL